MRYFRKLRNAPIDALGYLNALLVEALTICLLWRFEPDHGLALLFSALTGSMTIMGMVAGAAASRLKADARPQVAARAFRARIVSIMLTLPTVFVGAGSLAIRMEDRAAAEYRASEAYRETLKLAQDSDDARVRQQAALDLERAVAPTQARYDDPAFIGGLLSYLCITLLPLAAVSFARVFAPETEGEAKRREQAVRDAENAARRAAAAAKGQKTRAEKRKAEAKRLGKLKVPGVPNVLELVKGRA